MCVSVVFWCSFCVFVCVSAGGDCQWMLVMVVVSVGAVEGIGFALASGVMPVTNAPASRL